MSAESLTPDFQLLFDASPDKAIVLTPDLTIAAVSDSYLQTTMRDRNIIGRKLFDVFPENPDTTVQEEHNIRASFEAVARTKKTDVMPVIQYDVAAEDGGFEQRYWQLKTFPILDEKGEIKYFFHRVEDVTAEIVAEQHQQEQDRINAELQAAADQNEAERRQAEAELKDTFLRLDAALEAGEIGTWTFDVVNNKVYADKSLAKIFSVSEAEARGGKLESYTDSIFEEDRERVAQIITESLQKSDSYEAEYRIVQPDKSLRWVMARGNVVRDANGQPLSLPGVVLDITSQKESADALRESERRLKFALEAGQLGSYQLDIESGEMICSVKCKANFGVAPEDDLPFELLINLIHPDDREKMQSTVQQAIENNTNYDIEYRIIRPNGEPAWIMARGRTHLDPRDKRLKMSGVTLDITARKNAEETMRESQERLQLASRATYDAIWDWDLTTNNVWWNEAVQTLTGHTADEVRNDSTWWYEHIHPEDRERVVHGIHEVIDSGGENWTDEYRFLKADGGFKHVYDRGFIVHRDGQPIRMLGAMQDITESKRSEKALRESQERLQIVLDASKVGLWYCDLPFDILNWSDRTKEHFWLPPSSVVPIELFYEIIHPEDREPTRIAIDKSIADKTTYDIEYRTVNPNTGEVKWIRAVGRGFYDENGDPYRFDGITIDVTADKQAIAEREQILENERSARDEAETANRLKDEFLATLSHELRTPLSSILGWSRLLKERQVEGEQAIRAIETIERNARSQSQLIEDILDVSRIVSGKLRLDVRPVELASIIEQAIESIRPAAEAKNIRLQRVIDSGGMISGDADRLQQIIWNLLSNAIKFTPKEGRVQIKLERVNSHVEIIIVDNGIGIEEDALPIIFERFRQSDSSTTRKYGGLGLGLAIVRHLVELHGGTVHAASEGLNKGAVFTVMFPLIPLRSNELTTIEEAERVHPTVAGNVVFDCPAEIEGLKILLVDDEPDARGLVEYVLQACKATVESVSSVDKALEVIKSGHFDVLISDIGMPGRDGYDLIKSVRQLSPEEGGRIPAVALTAYARVEDRMKVLTAGFHMHVPKPVEPAELLAVVASLASWNKQE